MFKVYQPRGIIQVLGEKTTFSFFVPGWTSTKDTAIIYQTAPTNPDKLFS
jgi:hypothetical protein